MSRKKKWPDHLEIEIDAFWGIFLGSNTDGHFGDFGCFTCYRHDPNDPILKENQN